MNSKKNSAKNLTDSIPFTGNDAQEYFSISDGLIELLKERGDYEPALHDLLIDRVARHTIILKRCDMFLLSEKASEHTFVSVADAKVKFAKIIDNALNEMGITPQNRPSNQTADQMTELTEFVRKGLHDPGSSNHETE